MTAPTKMAGGHESGSGTVLGVAVIAATVALCLLTMSVYLALAVRQSVSGAADAAALAAADVASGLIAGYPCRAAADVAAAHQGALAECRIDGLIATVAVSRTYLGLPITVAARAGPPGSG